MKQWGKGFSSEVGGEELHSSATEIREGERGGGEMSNVHNPVCPFLPIVILKHYFS